MDLAQARPHEIGEATVRIVERQTWLEPLAAWLQRVVRTAYEAGGPTGRRVRDLLHGTWLGHPFHPVLTDVPLGAWIIAGVLDASGDGRSRERAADAAISIGVAGALGAAVTGLTDWHHTAGDDRRVGLVHALANVSATAFYAISLGARARNARTVGRRIAWLGLGLATAAAYLGGHLVYRKRVGVDHAHRPTWDDYVIVLGDTDLRDGEPHRVVVAGVPILLLRRGASIFALGETCAHLGGPLSEGSFDERSVRCPWHGSRFALADGRVLEGPSTFTQPGFDVRVRDGQIELRPRAGA